MQPLPIQNRQAQNIVPQDNNMLPDNPQGLPDESSIKRNPITQVTGPCVILAGAGTGKTRALVEKVVHLTTQKIYNPQDIVCLTFSNEAARSMEARIADALEAGGVEGRPTVRTFHALCSDIIKEHGNLIGLSQDFRILQPDDAMIMLHKNLRIPAHLCGEYVSAIGTAKDLGIALEEYQSFLEKERTRLPENIEKELETAQFELRTMHARKANKEDKNFLIEKVQELSLFIRRQRFLNAWRAYEKLKIKRNVEDYADLNANALIILKNRQDITKKWKYFLVDEFQDTNKVQIDLIEALVDNRNITIVGDINQSIYRFRGAYKNNLDLFKKIFHVTQKDIFTIDQSYRSPNTVLRTAHKIIAHNYYDKGECFQVVNAESREGNPIKVFEMKNGKEEVRKILEIVKEEISHGRKPEDICVMFRTHQQTNMLKKSLEHENIPYQSTTKKSLLKHPIIRRVINYLTIINSLLVDDNNSKNSWWGLIRGQNFTQEDELILSDYLRRNRGSENPSKIMISALEKISLSEEGKLKFFALIVKIKSLMQHASKPVPEIIEEIYRLLDTPELEKTKEGREALLALEELKKKVTEQNMYEFFDLPTFMHHIDIIRALQLELETPSIEERGIKIMTAHATKGLEYPVVIVANMVQKKFPLEKFSTKPIIPPECMPDIKDELKNAPTYLHDEMLKEYEQKQQLRDERRLCYVAFTRAKESLYLTYAMEYNAKPHEPSVFLEEAAYRENKDIVLEKDDKENYLEPSPKITSGDYVKQKDKKIIFSPSSLKLFVECQKKYEYKYVLNMPEEKPPSWEAIKLGSFLHKVIEHGVREGLANERSFLLFAREESLKPEWESLDVNDALLLLKVFFERNKSKYTKKSLSERHLYTELDNITFHGIADRIDFNKDGLEIIDYKTGYASVPPQERNWQLGLYALAATNMGPVKRVTLDMLRHDRPLEFDIDKNGLAIERNTRKMSFKLEEVKKELVQTANKILESYQRGFSPCPIEKNCEFCDQYVWGK